MTLKYLVTGATGGMGSGVLSYFVQNLPSSSFAASSSRASSVSQFAPKGISFRHADYNDPSTLEEAFAETENLLFVSSNTFDNELRTRQHLNVVEAAKKCGVQHVWYTSLAFGGLNNTSKIAVQEAHLATEKMLRESGITYTSIRDGVYAEAFPLFLSWYPSTKTIYLPSDGAVAYTSRAELVEATARLMIAGGYENKTVLLTALKAYAFRELVNIINEASDRMVTLQIVNEDRYLKAITNDEGGKPTAFFQALLSWYEGISEGDGSAIDPLMEKVLERKPMDAKEVITSLLKRNRDYRWHQSYVKTRFSDGQKE